MLKAGARDRAGQRLTTQPRAKAATLGKGEEKGEGLSGKKMILCKYVKNPALGQRPSRTTLAITAKLKNNISKPPPRRKVKRRVKAKAEVKEKIGPPCRTLPRDIKRRRGGVGRQKAPGGSRTRPTGATEQRAGFAALRYEGLSGSPTPM
jgi:hypothetical protein